MQAMTINGTQQAIREFNGQRVVTFRDIDRIHGRPFTTARNAFVRNRKHFVENIDYFLPKSGGSTFNVLPQTQGLDDLKSSLCSPQGITLLTESGYLMLVKSFGDDLAWAIQRELVNCYFKVHKPETPPLFTSQAVVPVDTKPNLPEKPVSVGKHLVVDVPRNQEAQQLISEIKNAAMSLPVVLGLFNRYQSKENEESYKKVICDLGLDISRLCHDLKRLKTNLIEQPK